MTTIPSRYRFDGFAAVTIGSITPRWRPDLSLAPLIPDPALAEDEWLKRAREQMDRANAAMPAIMDELRRSGALRPMKRSAFTPLDPDREYVPGFEEDWTHER